MKATRSCADRSLPAHRLAWPKAVAALSLASILTTAVAGESENMSADERNAEAEQVTGTVCASACHGWESIFAGPLQTPGQWDFIVSDMISRGAYASEEELDQVRQYLNWAWGSVWINSAGAQDLVAVLGLPEDDAEAVIAYRDEHGPFADIASLKAVPGIDQDTIDSQADAITFD